MKYKQITIVLKWIFSQLSLSLWGWTYSTDNKQQDRYTRAAEQFAEIEQYQAGLIKENYFF